MLIAITVRVLVETHQDEHEQSACGDITQMSVSDRRVGTYPPPFPSGKGAYRLMSLVSYQVDVLFEGVLASPPWGTRTRATASGRRERGLSAQRKTACPYMGVLDTKSIVTQCTGSI